MTLLTNTCIGSTDIAAVHAVYCQSYPECSRFIARLYQTRGRTQVLLHITVHSRCHPFANRLKIVHVAVLDRLFRRVFWAHHQVWCVIALRFHWGQGSYTLHRCVHMFTHRVYYYKAEKRRQRSKLLATTAVTNHVTKCVRTVPVYTCGWDQCKEEGWSLVAVETKTEAEGFPPLLQSHHFTSVCPRICTVN